MSLPTSRRPPPEVRFGIRDTLGSTPVWLAIFALVAGWLAWRRLPRLAVFAVVTAGVSPLLNTIAKLAVDRARPVLPDPSRAGGLPS